MLVNEEKVKAIKSGLECLAGRKACTLCEYGESEDEGIGCVNLVADDALDLIEIYEGQIKILEKLLDKKCDKCIERERKETAREVIGKLRDMKRGFYIEFSLMEEYEFNGILDKLEKQCGVEIKE